MSLEALRMVAAAAGHPAPRTRFANLIASTGLSQCVMAAPWFRVHRISNRIAALSDPGRKPKKSSGERPGRRRKSWDRSAEFHSAGLGMPVSSFLCGDRLGSAIVSNECDGRRLRSTASSAFVVPAVTTARRLGGTSKDGPHQPQADCPRCGGSGRSH